MTESSVGRKGLISLCFHITVLGFGHTSFLTLVPGLLPTAPHSSPQLHTAPHSSPQLHGSLAPQAVPFLAGEPELYKS